MYSTHPKKGRWAPELFLLTLHSSPLLCSHTRARSHARPSKPGCGQLSLPHCFFGVMVTIPQVYLPLSSFKQHRNFLYTHLTNENLKAMLVRADCPLCASQLGGCDLGNGDGQDTEAAVLVVLFEGCKERPMASQDNWNSTVREYFLSVSHF